jgi:hypothetical protein
MTQTFCSLSVSLRSVARFIGAAIDVPAPKIRDSGIPSARQMFAIVKPSIVNDTPNVWKPSSFV